MPEHPGRSDSVSIVDPVDGTWRSLVAHLLWEQGVGSSNLPVPTKSVGQSMVGPSAPGVRCEARKADAKLEFNEARRPSEQD